jgi:hypothetical protein
VSEVNAEILRLAYAAISRHGPEAGAEFADETVEILDSTEQPVRRSQGLSALAEIYGQAGSYFDELALLPVELIDAGEAVVVCLRVGGTAVSGVEAWTRTYHVHWMRDARTVRLEVCGDRVSALRAAATHSAPEPLGVTPREPDREADRGAAPSS